MSPHALPVPPLIADAERAIVDFLRDSAAIDDQIGDRVYTAYPREPGNDPFLLVQRVGGAPPLSQPLVIDEALLQLDAYGGRKVEAHALIVTARAELCSLPGHNGVSSVAFGALRWQPDETFNPSRPRYLADVTVHVRAVVPPAVREEATVHG